MIFNKKTDLNQKGFEMDSLKSALFVNKALIKGRGASSHKLQYNTESDTLTEEKIYFEAGIDGIQSLFGHYSHFYLNLPMGGVGNLWPEGDKYVGPEGYAYTRKVDKKDKKIKFKKVNKLQHGHMYLRFHKLHNSPTKAAIIFGIENEEDGHKGMFSLTEHGPGSAITKKSEAVCSGIKWDLVDHIENKPHGYGGRAVFLKDLDFSVYDKIEAFYLELKKKVWWIILSSDNEEFLEFYVNFPSKYNGIVLSQKIDDFVQMKNPAFDELEFEEFI